jgi:hypothetical protein
MPRASGVPWDRKRAGSFFEEVRMAKTKKKFEPTIIKFTFTPTSEKEQKAIARLTGEICAAAFGGIEKIRPGTAQRLLEAMKARRGKPTGSITLKG